MNESMTPPLQREIPFGLTHQQLEFEDLTLEAYGPDLDLHEMLSELEMLTGRNKVEEARIYEAALALYEKKCHDTTWDWAPRHQLFALCLNTALIWERG